MRTSTRILTLALLAFGCLATLLHAHSTPGAHERPTGGGHSGLPIPETTLHAKDARVPFTLPETFPVPMVEVTLNGTGPWRLGVDTAMGGTVMLRKDRATKMGLPVIGQAMVGDSSGKGLKPADLVRIDSMRLGELEVSEIIGISFAAGEAHLSEVPDEMDGILGNRIYAELLMTLDYPNDQIVFRQGELAADDPSVVGFEDKGNVMAVDMSLAGRSFSLVVDSGSRSTITLPKSLADELPLREALQDIKPVSTVSYTYQRQAARLKGEAAIAGATMVDPEIGFADEHTPRLIGYGVLKHFALTVDQAHGRLQWVPTNQAPIDTVTIER